MNACKIPKSICTAVNGGHSSFTVLLMTAVPEYVGNVVTTALLVSKNSTISSHTNVP